MYNNNNTEQFNNMENYGNPHQTEDYSFNYGQTINNSFQDPHLAGSSISEYVQTSERGFQDFHSDYGMGPGEGESMEERFKARRAEQMYQRLAEQGRFSEIDKAKHNEHYRDYLLENFEDELY